MHTQDFLQGGGKGNVTCWVTPPPRKFSSLLVASVDILGGNPGVPPPLYEILMCRYE